MTRHDKLVITSKLYYILFIRLHTSKLKVHIMKKARWTEATFQKVDWDGHGTAFHRLNCQSKIHTAKLIHQLVNTNHQNQLY
jgi:hypothetical protein